MGCLAGPAKYIAGYNELEYFVEDIVLPSERGYSASEGVSNLKHKRSKDSQEDAVALSIKRRHVKTAYHHDHCAHELDKLGTSLVRLVMNRMD